MNKKVSCSLLSALVSIFLLGNSAHANLAGLTGDTAWISLSGMPGFSLMPSAPYPAVIGGGSEFAGIATDNSYQLWSITADIGASVFEVRFNELSTPYNQGYLLPHAGSDVLHFIITDLDWVGATGYRIQGVNLARFATNNTYAPFPHLSSITYGPHNIDIGFDALYSSDRYKFQIEFAQVPIPAASWLFGTGLLGFMGISRRFRR